MTLTLRFALIPEPSALAPVPRERVISVSAPLATTWGQLSALLDPASLPCSASVDGELLTGDMLLGEPPLVDGGLIEPMRVEATEHGLRLVSVCGPRQAHGLPLVAGDHDLSRGHDVLGDDPLVSRRHAVVSMRRGEVIVRDLSSSNGLTLEGIDVGEAGRPWHVGEHLRIGASVLRLDVARPERIGHDSRDVDDGGEYPSTCASPLVDERALRPRVFSWPALPQAPKHTPVQWIAVLAPLPLAVVFAWFMHAPMMLCFMLLGPLVLLATHVDDRRKGRRLGRREKTRRAAEVRRAGVDVAAALDAERRALHALAPAPDILLDMAQERRPLQPVTEARLPGMLRLGHGDAVSRHRLEPGGERGASELNLTETPVSSRVSQGVLVHLDVDPNALSSVFESITAQLAWLEPVGPTRPTILTLEADRPRWLWARLSPVIHATTTVPRDLADRLDVERNSATESPPLPLIVLDARVPMATQCLDSSIVAGARVVWVGPHPAAHTIETCRSKGVDIQRHHLASGHRGAHSADGHTFTIDTPPADWFPTLMRRSLSRHADGARAHSRGGPELTQATPQDYLPTDLPTAWSRPTMAVPIGTDGDGLLHLDLSRTGPHALIAGTTGAGKSEFLLTYLRGLFTLNSPNHVNALLIDYKGGATFGALMRAPHVVGVVTDLDDGLAARALIALRAEIRRRERVLSDAGFASYREAITSPSPPAGLARLFVIVDEFRVLAEELPDFVSGLVRLAAVGRSLGMHLVLATQRPGGAVTADMRANLDVRVALRVRERSDSIDVIETPAAARISPSTPGRGYLALSGEEPREFQSAYTGAGRRGPAAPSIHVHHLDESAEPDLRDASCPACRPTNISDRSDLDLFVDEAITAGLRLPPAYRPLLPPLPDVITRHSPPHTLVALDDLTRLEPPLRQETSEIFAVADLPAAQRQPGVSVCTGSHIGIAGAPASGRTTTACALVAARRATDLTPVWWVGAQRPTASGDIPSDRFYDPDDPDAIVQLLTALADEPTASFLVIDGWEALQTTLLRINHGTALEDMLRHIEQAHRHGRTFVVTGSRAILSSKLSGVLDVKVVLRQNDPSDYSLAGLRPAQVPAQMPPGRGLVLPHGHVVQILQPIGERAGV